MTIENTEAARLHAENQHLRSLMTMGGHLPPEIVNARTDGAVELAALLSGLDSDFPPLYDVTADIFSAAEVVNLDEIYADDLKNTRMEQLIRSSYLSRNQKGRIRLYVNARIKWTGIPNNAMKPVNNDAKAIFDAWQRSITPWGMPLFTWEERGGAFYKRIEDYPVRSPVYTLRYRILGFFRQIKHKIFGGYQTRRRHEAIYDHQESVDRRRKESRR